MSNKRPADAAEEGAAAAASASADTTAPAKRRRLAKYISLTTHPKSGKPVDVNWGDMNPTKRGPVVAVEQAGGLRNAIGAHGGSYCVYKAMSVATGGLDPNYKPNLHNTHPVFNIGPHPSWQGNRIVTLDPWGHLVASAFKEQLDAGVDIRPTIAVTKAHIDILEIKQALEQGRLTADGAILKPNGQVVISKAAVEPVWYLPGLANRLGISEAELRHTLFQHTNGMYPELLTRTDMHVFLPPIGGLTVYIFGDPAAITDPDKKLAVRVHDECNGSDVFGSDICTCRPYLIHGIEVCVKTAQEGGAGIIVYFRKEGRALGEVTKYLVYNARKRQEGGDRASEYFRCTANVAGIEDARFQSMMPDVLLWLGITRIDTLMSMSDMKYNAITGAGIQVVNRVPLPPHLVPEDAKVELTAKVFAGYEGGSVYSVTEEDLQNTKGRERDCDKK